MTVVAMIGFALLFLALVMASIALHEVGHMVPAKLFGVKVTEYFVGFGKRLWTFRRGETEYGIKLLPLGGYVRLVGMYPPAKATGTPPGWLTRVADNARSYEYETITEADRGRLFYEKKTWQKIIIMAGGPAMNIILAFLIFLGLNVFHGTYQPTLTVATVSDCIIAADREDPTCRAEDPVTPALKMGIEVGDVLVSFNGTTLSSWEQMGDLIRENRDQPAVVEVLRDGQTLVLPEVPTALNHVADRLDPSKTVEAGFLGVAPTQEHVYGGAAATAKQMWTMTKQSVVALSTIPVRIYHTGADLVMGKPRDPNGPISIVGASMVAGEIGVTDKLDTASRVASWFSLLGSVNLFVALLNLVPLVPFDGGHIAGAIYEWLKRGVARLRGKPDPGHVDTAKMLPVVYVVGGFLLLGGVVLIAADILSPIRLF
ncbi:M50 family metallopeptidase [Tessaracoccus caeni]|uniref:M50 family metallopeptidase n=1 Tax=Tessaracoccus caeni TaxID=3031239 RepID=UPI0023DB596B|nr:site-2 protease family protein [Tessaracoccus caeni]MDF1486768.1 site-2 protease family protein [Tessaracoccus caeni]